MKLEDLFTMRQGLTFGKAQPQPNWAKVYMYLQLSTLKNGRVDVSGALKGEQLIEEIAQPHVPRPGALIVSLRTPGLPVAVVDREMPGYVVSNNLAMLTLRPEHLTRVRPEFVALVLQSRGIQKRIEPLYTGIHPVSLPMRLFRQITVGIPQIEVQDALLGMLQAIRQEEDAFRHYTEVRLEVLEECIDPYTRQAFEQSSSAQRSS